MPIAKPSRVETVPHKHVIALSRRVAWLGGRLDGRPATDKGASFESAEMEALLYCMERLNVPYKKPSGRPHVTSRDLEEPPRRPDATLDVAEVWVPGAKGSN